MFGPILSPVVRGALRGRKSLPPKEVLNETWREYGALLPSIPKQENFGGGLVVRSAALTIAFYRALVARGLEPGIAEVLVASVTWRLYRVVSRIPWLAARLLTRDPHRRLLVATRILRRFPLGSPSYVWKEVDAEPDVVAFDCLRCSVAEYFASQGHAKLCVATFCELDFPLAAQWKTHLVRSGTIAAGDKRCDFRWRPINGTPPHPAQRSDGIGSAAGCPGCYNSAADRSDATDQVKDPENPIRE